MSVVQIFPRAEEPSAQVLSVSPAVEPDASTMSPEPLAGIPVAVDPLPVSEPYPLDRAFHAMLARLTGGISPLALSLAWLDWSSHLAAAPQRQVEMSRNVVRDMGQFMEAAARDVAKAVVRDCTAGTGSSLQGATVGSRTVQSACAGVPAWRALVARCHDRRTWRVARKRSHRRILDASDARHAGAVEFRGDQSASAGEGVPERRGEFRVRLAELVQRPDAPALQLEVGGLV